MRASRLGGSSAFATDDDSARAPGLPWSGNGCLDVAVHGERLLTGGHDGPRSRAPYGL